MKSDRYLPNKIWTRRDTLGATLGLIGMLMPVVLLLWHLLD